MALPFFYSEEIEIAAKQFVLNEETSKHVVQVLRMQNGEQLQLTNGKGNLFVAEITDPNKKKCAVKILAATYQPPLSKNTSIAISLVKNAHRFEWFLEKATEIGVGSIIPLICTRTEKQHFRTERMKSILISAMLQSQQTWLPGLQEQIKFSDYIKNTKYNTHSKKFIAHCKEEEARTQLNTYQPFSDSIILIGPEGDFTIDEIEMALQNGFSPVALGNTRLRTETAGVVAVTMLQI
ncbi:MAG: 16S rRNA (uracil(1498)-N(3))-methyltransferase [Ferruginibacter sp.]